MTDIPLRCVRAIHERTWRRHPTLRGKELLTAGVESVVATAVIQVRTTAHCRAANRKRLTAPASDAKRVRFCEELPSAEMNGPQTVALGSSLKVTDCLACHGNGYLTCAKCGGRGELLCVACEGGMSRKSGGPILSVAGLFIGGALLNSAIPTLNFPELVIGSGVGAGMVLLGLLLPACMTCRSRGKHRCPDCSQGRLTHDVCQGEGRIASWEEASVTFSSRVLTDMRLPLAINDASLTEAVTQLFARDGSPALPMLTRDTVASVFGDESPDLTEPIAAALRSQNLLEHRAHGLSAECLSVETDFRLVPLAGCRLRLEDGSPADFWRVGRGEHAVDLWTVPDRARSEGHSLTKSISDVAAAVSQTVSSESRVVVVAFVHRTVHPMTFLRLLVSLGAMVREFDVLGGGYRAHLEALLAEPAASAWSVVVKLRDGQLVRLIELPGSVMQAASDLIQICDVVVSVEEGGGAQMPSSAAPEMRLCVDMTASTCDIEGWTPDGAIAIDALRRCFLRELDLEVVWPAVFSNLWATVGEALPRESPVPLSPTNYGQHPTR